MTVKELTKILNKCNDYDDVCVLIDDMYYTVISVDDKFLDDSIILITDK